MKVLLDNRIYDIENKYHEECDIISYLKLLKVDFQTHNLLNHTQLIEILDDKCLRLIKMICRFTKELRFFNKKIILVENEDKKVFDLRGSFFIEEKITELKTKTKVERYFLIERYVKDTDRYEHRFIKITLEYEKYTNSLSFDKIKITNTNGNNKIIKNNIKIQKYIKEEKIVINADCRQNKQFKKREPIIYEKEDIKAKLIENKKDWNVEINGKLKTFKTEKQAFDYVEAL